MNKLLATLCAVEFLAACSSAAASSKREWQSELREDPIDGSFAQAKANFDDPMAPRIYLKCQNKKSLLYFSVIGSDFPVGVNVKTLVRVGNAAPIETNFKVVSKTDASRLQLMGSQIDQDLYHSIVHTDRIGIRVFDPGSDVYYSGLFEIDQPTKGLQPLVERCP